MSIDVIGIVTRNRTTELIECVASYADNCRRHDRRTEVVVMDDSRSSDGDQPAPAALSALARATGLPIRYAGVDDRRRFAARLAAEAGVGIEIVAFGLVGDERCDVSTGANRNGLLLDTVDELVFSADDDTVCRIARAPDGTDTPAFHSSADPTEFWFFADQPSALERTPPIDADLLGLHESLLGQAVGDAAAPAGRVAVTMNGLAGDCGMASPRYFLSLEGASRERLVASEDAYRAALRSRAVVRTARRPSICAESFVMTTFFGFDNRSLLPPFLPVQRNSDGVFGVMLPRCIRGGCVGFLPWTLQHAPVAARQFAADDIWIGVDRLRLSDVVIDCVLAQATAAAPTDAIGLEQLGARLRRLGSLSVGAFDEHVRAVQAHRSAAFTTLLSHRLLVFQGLPPFWADDVRRVIDRSGKALAAQDLAVPRDLTARHDADTARRLSQELIVRFGELVAAWPAIVDAAVRLRADGVRLSRPVLAAG